MNAPGRQTVILAVILILICLAVYAQVGGFEFVAYDDDVLVYENPRITEGLTWSNIDWAFTSFSNLNWVPLARLSHMLDVELFGLDPGGHHAVNLILHILAALLLQAALYRMTGAPLRSFAVAALFAVHPLHVESVAWVSERRDVLSGCLWGGALWAYGGYVRRPSPGAYLSVALLLSLGLMSKPTFVTFPLVLLLLDYWPLRRLNGDWSFRRGKLFVEKIPFFLIAAAAGGLTFAAQNAGGAVQPLAAYPLDLRLSNAAVSYVVYLQKMVWPTDLMMFYPYPASIPAWQGIGALAILAAATAAVLRMRTSCPALATGWLWYLVTLLPVAGILQTGVQARADRYTYLPLTGIGILAVWGLDRALSTRQRGRMLLAAAGLAFLVLFGTAARRQAGFWSDSDALFEHALRVDPDNWLAQNSYGLVQYRQGKIEEAITYYTRAVELRPEYTRARNNLGAAFHSLGRTDDAIAQYEAALRVDPSTVTVLYNLGLARQKKGDPAEAERAYRRALEVDTDYADANHSLGKLLRRRGRLKEGLGYLRRAVELEPGRDTYRVSLARNYLALGDSAAAAGQLREALRLNPGNRAAALYLERVLGKPAAGTP